MRRLKPDSFRQQLSITQKYMAEYLGISQTLLSLFEKGLRKLPNTAALKLSKLELAFYQLQQTKTKKTVAPIHPNLQKHNDKTKKTMEKHAATCSYKKKKAQRQLELMAKEHEKAILLMSILDNVVPAGIKSQKNNLDHLWIEVQKNEAIKKMMRYGDAAQTKLQAKILTLEGERAVYKRLHGKMK